MAASATPTRHPHNFRIARNRGFLIAFKFRPRAMSRRRRKTRHSFKPRLLDWACSSATRAIRRGSRMSAKALTSAPQAVRQRIGSDRWCRRSAANRCAIYRSDARKMLQLALAQRALLRWEPHHRRAGHHGTIVTRIGSEQRDPSASAVARGSGASKRRSQQGKSDERGGARQVIASHRRGRQRSRTRARSARPAPRANRTARCSIAASTSARV